MVPEAARKHYVAWKETGRDNELMALLSSMFASLEVTTFDEVYANKGDATLIKEDLVIDSLALAELLFYTEDLLGSRIPNEDVVKIQSIGDLKRYVIAHCNAIEAK